MPSEYHIASLVVLCQPDQRELVLEQIAQADGMEVHGQSDDGKLVVTVEGQRRAEVQTGLEAISQMDGVMSAALTYHRVEPLNDQELS